MGRIRYAKRKSEWGRRRTRLTFFFFFADVMRRIETRLFDQPGTSEARGVATNTNTVTKPSDLTIIFLTEINLSSQY